MVSHCQSRNGNFEFWFVPSLSLGSEALEKPMKQVLGRRRVLISGNPLARRGCYVLAGGQEGARNWG